MFVFSSSRWNKSRNGRFGDAPKQRVGCARNTNSTEPLTPLNRVS